MAARPPISKVLTVPVHPLLVANNRQETDLKLLYAKLFQVAQRANTETNVDTLTAAANSELRTKAHPSKETTFLLETPPRTMVPMDNKLRPQLPILINNNTEALLLVRMGLALLETAREATLVITEAESRVLQGTIRVEASGMG